MVGTFLLYAVLSGLMLALGWLSWSTPAFIFVAFVPLWVAAYKLFRAQARHAFAVFWLITFTAFLTWNVVDTFWLRNSTWPGFVAAALLNAAFVTVVTMAGFWVARRRGFLLGMIFWAALWISFEKLHSEWDLAWPLLTLGNGFARYAGFVQWYEYTGVFGGSLWVLAANIVAFYAWKAYAGQSPREVLYRRIGVFAGVVILPMLLSWAVTPRGDAPKDSRSIEAIALQPNIDPYGEKFTTATDSAMAARMFEMVDTLLDPQVRLIAAPETYLSQYKQVDSPGRYPVFDTLRAFSARNGGLTVVTGSSFVRYFYDEASVTPTANRSRYGDFWYDVYNSAVQIDTQGMDRYEKSKLVPGVECFPFRSVLEGVLGDIMIDMGGMAGSNVTQDDREVFVSQGGTMRLAPIICYEALFGEFVAGYVRKGANVLCIITNDGWWGNTEGHRQMLWIARLRAIETRLPIIRSANTGVSAFLTPDGRITGVIPYGQQGVLRGTLVLAEREPTFYVRHGDYIPRVAVWVAAALLLFSVLPGRRKR